MEKVFQGGTAPLVDDLGNGSHVPVVKVLGGGAGGGGGAAGGAGTPVVDNAGVRWLWIYDKDTSTSTYISFATGAAGTPTFPITPDSDTAVQVSNFPANPATSTLQTTANTLLASIDADIGLTTDAVATSDTGTFSLIALVKRGLTNWTTLLARIPALVSGRIPVDGSGVTQPVIGTVAVSNFPANPATSALQTTGNTSLSNIDSKLPALASGRVPVNSSIPTSASGTILALTTPNPGTGWMAFTAQACVALDIVNNSGVTIEYRRNAAGTAMQIPTGAARMIIGITNANQIEVRRTDTSNTTVTLQAEAFTA